MCLSSINCLFVGSQRAVSPDPPVHLPSAGHFHSPTSPFIVNLVALRHAKTTEVIDDMTDLGDEANRVMSVISASLGG